MWMLCNYYFILQIWVFLRKLCLAGETHPWHQTHRVGLSRVDESSPETTLVDMKRPLYNSGKEPETIKKKGLAHDTARTSALAQPNSPSAMLPVLLAGAAINWHYPKWLQTGGGQDAGPCSTSCVAQISCVHNTTQTVQPTGTRQFQHLFTPHDTSKQQS